jgi:hypothetical protein
LHGLDSLEQWLGHYSEALSIAERAYRIRLELGDRHGQAKSLNMLGNSSAELRNCVEAKNHYERVFR